MEQPKDRTKNMKKAAETYEQCQKIDAKDVDIQRALAGTYMALGEYDKAAPLLERVARQGKNVARRLLRGGESLHPTHRHIDGTIRAWDVFLAYVPKKDPRYGQVTTSLKILRAEQAKR